METRTWSTPECPFTIEYTARVLDDIRLAVVDAFFSLPRGGAEIGGILLGRRNAGRLSITGSSALDCEHAYGPSFTLSPKDRAKLAELLSSARTNGSQPVGWYHSHTRSEIFLSEADLEIHKRFFPEPWQVALVLKPHTFQPTRAGFFFSDSGGAIQAAAAHQEFVLDPLPAQPVPQGPSPAETPAGGFNQAGDTEFSAAGGPVITLDAIPELADGQPVEPVDESPAQPPKPPVLEFPGRADQVEGPVPPPKFLAAEPRGRWRVGVMAVIIGAGLGALAYQTADRWLPLLKRAGAAAWSQPEAAIKTEAPPPPTAPPPISLAVSEQAGQMQIRWNPQSEAISGAERGVVTIVDGASTWNIDLDSARLRSGAVNYSRQSERVDVALRLFRSNAPESREFSTFVGKLPQDTRKQQDEETTRLKTQLSDQEARTQKLERSIEDMKKQLDLRTRMGNQAPDTVKK